MKISEAFKILKLLYALPTTTGVELSEITGVDRRSVYRYINEFIISGIPIEVQKGRYGGISLPKCYKTQLNTLGGLIKAYAEAN